MFVERILSKYLFENFIARAQGEVWRKEKENRNFLLVLKWVEVQSVADRP
jgi:hypothetical protein